MDNCLDNGWCHSAEISVIHPHKLVYTVWDPLNNTHCRITLRLTSVFETDDEGSVITYPVLRTALRADFFEGNTNRAYYPSFRQYDNTPEVTKIILHPPGHTPPAHLTGNNPLVDRVKPPVVRNIWEQQDYKQRTGASPPTQFVPARRLRFSSNTIQESPGTSPYQSQLNNPESLESIITPNLNNSFVPITSSCQIIGNRIESVNKRKKTKPSKVISFSDISSALLDHRKDQLSSLEKNRQLSCSQQKFSAL